MYIVNIPGRRSGRTRQLSAASSRINAKRSVRSPSAGRASPRRSRQGLVRSKDVVRGRQARQEIRHALGLCCGMRCTILLTPTTSGSLSAHPHSFHVRSMAAVAKCLPSSAMSPHMTRPSCPSIVLSSA